MGAAAVRYLSLFSGIEAASVAWGPLGWEPAAFAEIDPFPCAVLEKRYPGVQNLGDVSGVDWRKFVKRRGKPDVLVGGSPCQSFSIAGSRTGLDGASGLMWEYVRAVREVRPRWVLWENVPGALSSSHGEDFRCLLEALDALGYGLAWRVLDAQFFGLAQRRERVFLVGRLGERPPVEVLFEQESVPWDPRSCREKRAELAAAAGRGAEGASFTLKLRHTGSDNPGGGAGPLVQRDASATLATSQDQTLFSFAQNSRDEVRLQGDGTLAGALPAQPETKQTTYVCETGHTGANGLGAGESDVHKTLGTSCDGAVVCIADDNAKAAIDRDMCGSLKVGGAPPMVAKTLLVRCGKEGGGKGALVSEDVSLTLATANAQALFPGGLSVRRITPRECERLQGFPDDWTKIPYRGKPADECPDGPRYKAIGNSMAVPVMRWIGERIGKAERGGLE
nr:MAG TPA: Cytosine specific methyltransferase [Caudoviricetes sp.]